MVENYITSGGGGGGGMMLQLWLHLVIYCILSCDFFFRQGAEEQLEVQTFSRPLTPLLCTSIIYCMFSQCRTIRFELLPLHRLVLFEHLLASPRPTGVTPHTLEWS